MRSRLLRLAAARFARLAALLTLLAASAAQAEPTVILLSWDGVRHDEPDRVATVALSRMQREGARAERLVPVFPSNTFPGHLSLATGTFPDRHGIVDNQFIDRERGRFDMGSRVADWLEAEPLWVAAERQGVRSAVYFWVGSESDWRGHGARYRMAPFDTKVSEAEKVQQIVRWLDLPAAERPHLILAWWHGTDAESHRRGPDDPSVAEALAQQDAQLAALEKALDARSAWSDTTLLVVSDHGMTVATKPVPVRATLEGAGIRSRISDGSTVAHVFLEDPAQLSRAEAVISRLEGVRVYRRDTLPDALRLRHPTRTGDLVVIASPPYALRESPLLERAARALTFAKRGMHGYDPQLPEMGGIFFALGRGVPKGTKLGAVRMIDVAPTVARLLGIDPPAQSEGKPIEGIGP